LSTYLYPDRGLSIAIPARERNCTAKNRVRELRSPGTVRDEGSNFLVYSDRNELDRGGHFADYEQPSLFVDEMHACFGTIR
jgi:hypothetical protein